jgi:predicted DNA-binding ribbon-helix-helix protein
MSFFKALFGSKKGIGEVLLGTQNKIFELYSISSPTDAQKMKASVYLCIAGIAILNDLGAGRLRPVIDRLAEETKNLTSSLKVKVSDLANDADQLKKILAEFPVDAKVTESTTLNGLAAFEALYFTFGPSLMQEIITRGDGPMGVSGYAAIVVGDGIFGKGGSKDHFLEISMELMQYSKALIETI